MRKKFRFCWVSQESTSFFIIWFGVRKKTKVSQRITLGIFCLVLETLTMFSRLPSSICCSANQKIFSRLNIRKSRMFPSYTLFTKWTNEATTKAEPEKLPLKFILLPTLSRWKFNIDRAFTIHTKRSKPYILLIFRGIEVVGKRSRGEFPLKRSRMGVEDVCKSRFTICLSSSGRW